MLVVVMSFFCDEDCGDSAFCPLVRALLNDSLIVENDGKLSIFFVVVDVMVVVFFIGELFVGLLFLAISMIIVVDRITNCE